MRLLINQNIPTIYYLIEYGADEYEIWYEQRDATEDFSDTRALIPQIYNDEDEYYEPRYIR